MLDCEKILLVILGILFIYVINKSIEKPIDKKTVEGMDNNSPTWHQVLLYVIIAIVLIGFVVSVFTMWRMQTQT